MRDAIQFAIEDTGLSPSGQKRLLKAIDSLSIVRTWTWPYDNLPGTLAEKLKRPNIAYKEYSEHGGNQPGLLFDEAARRISLGESKVAVLTGGEALASCKLPLINDEIQSQFIGGDISTAVPVGPFSQGIDISQSLGLTTAGPSS